MSDKDIEYEELLQFLEEEHLSGVVDTSAQKQEQKMYTAEPSMPKRMIHSEKTAPSLNQSVQRNRASRKPRYSPKRQIARKHNKRRWIIVGISVLVLILLITFIVVICNRSFDSKDNLAVLQGVWYYDEYTEYEFDGKGSGCMCIEETNHYEFTYIIDGDTLKIDYALDYVIDCEYDFKLENNKLTLIGGKGTANPGQEYILERVQ